MIKASGRFLAPRAAAATALCMLLGVTAAWALEPNEYRQILGLDSRKLIWFLAQVKLFFAAFVLGVPLFADIRFVEGVFTPVAFAAWDGSNGERGSRHTMTTWYWLLLEPPVANELNNRKKLFFSEVLNSDINHCRLTAEGRGQHGEDQSATVIFTSLTTLSSIFPRRA